MEEEAVNQQIIDKIIREIQLLEWNFLCLTALLEFWWKPEFIEAIGGYDANIIQRIHDALLSDIYLRIRCLLSVRQGDLSLAWLYKCILKPNCCKQKKYTQDLQKLCLPKSYNIWKEIQNYTNKNVAHLDSESIEYSPEIKFTYEDVEILISDLFSTLDKITISKENITYSNIYNAKSSSDSFFSKISSVMIPYRKIQLEELDKPYVKQENELLTLIERRCEEAGYTKVKLIAQNLLQAKVDIQIIADSTGLTKNDILKLAE